jgi:hypothetical protein
MTRDPCEKDMFTNINRRLINFTLRKSFGLYNIHYHEFTWIRRDNELQRKRYWNSFCAKARTDRWSSETIDLLSKYSYRIYFIIILRTISKNNWLKLPYYHQQNHQYKATSDYSLSPSWEPPVRKQHIKLSYHHPKNNHYNTAAVATILSSLVP